MHGLWTFCSQTIYSNNNVDSSILRIILFPEEKHGCRPIMTAMM